MTHQGATLIAVLVASACSHKTKHGADDARTAPSPGTVVAPSSSGSPRSASGAQPTSADQIDACAYFTAEIARAALGGPVGAAEDPAPGHERDDCGYALVSNPAQHVTVTVTRPSFSCENFIASAREEKDEEVKGIGQAAFLAGAGSVLTARWGVYDVLVSGHKSVGLDVMKRIATDVIAKIPQTDPNACAAPSADARCSGTPTSCDALKEHRACNGIDGCSLVSFPGKGDKCIGIASSCGSRTNESACTRQGCSWH